MNKIGDKKFFEGAAAMRFVLECPLHLSLAEVIELEMHWPLTPPSYLGGNSMTKKIN